MKERANTPLCPGLDERLKVYQAAESRTMSASPALVCMGRAFPRWQSYPSTNTPRYLRIRFRRWLNLLRYCGTFLPSVGALNPRFPASPLLRHLVGRPTMPKSNFRTIEKCATWQDIQRVWRLTELVLTGKRTMQMFCSSPGLGKTEIHRRSMKKFDVEPHRSAPASAAAYCEEIWNHRNSCFLFDDVDILARSEIANVTKGAWGSEHRVIVPNTTVIRRNEEYRLQGHEKYNPKVPPPTFIVGPKSCLLSDSNKNYSDPEVIRKESRADFAALVSKGLSPFWIRNEPQDLFDYCLWMVAADGMLRSHPVGTNGDQGGFSAAIQNEVIKFLIENATRLREISPRAVHGLAMSRRLEPEHYLSAWQQTLLPEARWNLEVPEVPLVGTRRSPTAPAPASVDMQLDAQMPTTAKDVRGQPPGAKMNVEKSSADDYSGAKGPETVGDALNDDTGEATDTISTLDGLKFRISKAIDRIKDSTPKKGAADLHLVLEIHQEIWSKIDRRHPELKQKFVKWTPVLNTFSRGKKPESGGKVLLWIGKRHVELDADGPRLIDKS
jgi:hypothetical protein